MTMNKLGGRRKVVLTVTGDQIGGNKRQIGQQTRLLVSVTSEEDKHLGHAWVYETADVNLLSTVQYGETVVIEAYLRMYIDDPNRNSVNRLKIVERKAAPTYNKVVKQHLAKDKARERKDRDLVGRGLRCAYCDHPIEGIPKRGFLPSGQGKWFCGTVHRNAFLAEYYPQE